MPRLVLVLASLMLVAPAAAQAADPPRLQGRAVLPADTFAVGPPAGTQLGSAPINDRTPPFPSQPVQGFSAVLATGTPGQYFAMPDNGFGAKNNSADFLLRMYVIKPALETVSGGAGRIAVGGIISLSDPDRKIPFPIARDNTTPRLLTGADFDIESVRIDRRGELWFGDEFGPWLLHANNKGRLLEAPIALPGVKSPDNQTLGASETANLPRSRGFEGMAISPDGHKLYVSLEGALTTDPDQRRRLVHTFNLDTRSYESPTRSIRLLEPGHAIGDLTALDECRLLLIERDNNQGPAAAVKRIDRLDLCVPSSDGFLPRTQVVDLLNVTDPTGISLPGRPGDFGLGNPFEFPFQTIESVLPIGAERLLVLNDNNYPFSAGRNAARPDDNEAITIDVPGLRSGGPPPAGATVDVQVLGLNDFHGNLEPPAGQIRSRTARASTPAASSTSPRTSTGCEATNPQHVVVSAGDLIGASPLLSALFHDEPTIEAMNRIGLDLNAVGNHEFDEGAAELLRMQNGGCHPVDGCHDGDGFAGADFQLPRGQRRRHGDRPDDLPALRRQERRRRRRSRFIGMTLEGTPEIVTPRGVAGLEFHDEADTVNALVPELQARGRRGHRRRSSTRAARPHGPDINECAGISGPIVDIVDRLDDEVDVVVTGHTHQAYNCVDRRHARHERQLLRAPRHRHRPDDRPAQRRRRRAITANNLIVTP